MDFTPTIALLQARTEALAATLAEIRLFPRLQQQLADEIAEKEAALASHQEALMIIQQHQAPLPCARVPEGRF